MKDHKKVPKIKEHTICNSLYVLGEKSRTLDAEGGLMNLY